MASVLVFEILKPQNCITFPARCLYTLHILLKKISALILALGIGDGMRGLKCGVSYALLQ